MDIHRPTPGLARRFASCAVAIAGLIVFTMGSVDAATVTVEAMNFAFQPDSQSVGVGDTVRWTFTGDPHTVTSGDPGSPDGRFDSGIKDPGGSFEVTFDTPGTFRYFCQIHPEQMTGTIVVISGPAATPTTRPTVKPTARPTARPTVRPTASPTARPSTKPTATAVATATATATTTATAAPISSPVASSTPSASASASAAVASAGSSAGPSASASPTAIPVQPDQVAAVSPVAIVAGVIVLIALGGGALLLARRRR